MTPTISSTGAIPEEPTDRDRTAYFQITTTTLSKDVSGKILDRLCGEKRIEDLLTTIFISRYLERMGDALLNIGEAIIDRNHDLYSQPVDLAAIRAQGVEIIESGIVSQRSYPQIDPELVLKILLSLT